MSYPDVLDIGTVARLSGLPASTLRYYEEKGLIRSTGRHGLRRLFDAGVMLKLDLITLGRNAGLSLDEIAGMFTHEGVAIDRDLLSTRADELDNSIATLIAMRDGLRHAAKCPADNHLECPSFQKLLRVAGKTRAKGPGRQKVKAV